MATDKKLIFKKGSSRPENPEIGTIFFNTGTRSIEVYVGGTAGDSKTGWQLYGGKVTNVELSSDNTKLTFTKVDGTTITFDHTVYVTNTTYNAKVSTLESNITKAQNAANAAGTAAENAQSTADEAVAAVGTEKTRAEGAEQKIASDLAAHISTYNNKVSTLESNITKAQNAANAAGTAASNEATRAQNAEKTISDALDAHKTAYNTKVTALAATDESLQDQIDELDTKVTSFGTPLRFRGVMDNAPTDKKEGDFYINTDGEEFVYAKTGSNSTLEWQKIGDTTAENTAITELKNDVSALKTKVGNTAVSTQISNAIGDLNSEKTSTGGTNIAVKVKQEAGEITTVTITKDDTAKATDLATLEDKVDAIDELVGDTSVESQINTAIGKLGATKTSEANKNIQVKVTQVDGVITAVSVTKDDTAKATDLEALEDEVDTLKSTVAAAIVWESFE